jgi:pimeloyl-ACP methyl ester carboxylesterase
LNKAIAQATAAEEVAFDDLGEGPAVVLIHDHPFDRSMWSAQHRPLASAGFRVIAPDLRGYGEQPAATSGKVTMREPPGDWPAPRQTGAVRG